MPKRDDDEYFTPPRTVDEAMAGLEDARRRRVEGQQAVDQQQTTVQAKDRSFSMTFDGRGALVDLTFHGTKYRGAAPTELASLILATYEKGRLESLEKMAEAMSSPALAGVDLVGIATGKADPDQIVNALLGPILGDQPGRGAMKGTNRG